MMGGGGAAHDRVAIQTVIGPVTADGFTSALAHEHLFVDFLGPADPRYQQVDWDEVRSVCVDRLAPVRAAGVDLLVDCTCIGVGRNVDLLREVSSSTEIRIACATGIYKALRPPELRDASVDELAALFVNELTVGIEGGGVRAGFVKLATTEDGPTEDETLVHRAGAMAAATARAAIVLHSPRADVAETVLRTLERDGFDPARLVWAHAQESMLEENLALAARGVTVSLDAIGTSDDAEMLRRIERFAEAGRQEQVLVSSDSSLVVHPAELAYERDIEHLHRTFLSELERRLGAEIRDVLTHRNVLRAFGGARDEHARSSARPTAEPARRR